MFSWKTDREVKPDPQPRPAAMRLEPDNIGKPLMENPSSIAKGPGNAAPSVITSDLTVTGNVVSKSEVQIDGIVQGDVHCATLIVGEGGQVTGGIVANDIVVRGKVVGSVRGVRVTLQGSSHVEGDVYHQSLAIEQGAFFEGKSRRSDDPTAAAGNVEPQARGQVQYAAPPRARPAQTIAGQPVPAKPQRAAE